MHKIYCVEDENSIRELIVYALQKSNYIAEGFEDSQSLYNKLDESIPDLILLDIMLPGDDGLKILNDLRKNPRTKDIPIIMVTARTSEFDRIKGLDMGADDYIVKPFSVMELISRVKAVLRRSIVKDELQDPLCINNICVDYMKRILRVDDKIINLTYKEFELLYYLFINKEIVLTREKIMSKIWGFDFEGETRTVDVHIASLRQKLGGKGKIIQTIRNVGYKVSE